MTFVPVTKNANKDKSALMVEDNEDPPFEKGMYVMRIAIKPRSHRLKRRGSLGLSYFTHNPFSHECRNPLEGCPVKGGGDYGGLELAYDNVTMVVVRHQHLDRITRNLDRKNIKVEFEMPYLSKYPKVKGVSTSSLMYHNESFKRMFDVMSHKPEFMFDNRFVFLFCITDMLYLKEVYEDDEFT